MVHVQYRAEWLGGEAEKPTRFDRFPPASLIKSDSPEWIGDIASFRAGQGRVSSRGVVSRERAPYFHKLFDFFFSLFFFLDFPDEESKITTGYSTYKHDFMISLSNHPIIFDS